MYTAEQVPRMRERADRKRSEHATAAAPRHPSIRRFGAAVYRCSLADACSLSSVSHTVELLAPASAPIIPTSTTAAKYSTKQTQQELDTERERARAGEQGDTAREKNQTTLHKLIFIVVFPELGKKAAAGRPARSGRAYPTGWASTPVLVVPSTPWKSAYIEEMVP